VTAPTGRYIGASLKRVEDRALMTGGGRYLDDIAVPGVRHVHFVRSPHGHARIIRLDASAARRAAGVVAVVTGADVKHLGQPSVNAFFPDMKIAPYPLLADGAVRFVGEPIAAVVADSVAAGRDAAELIEIDYEPLPAVVDAETAQGAKAPIVHESLGTNRALAGSWRAGDAAAAFASAARVVSVSVDQTRVAAVTMEPRGCMARYDVAADELTVWLTTQAPFRARGEIASVIGFGEHRIRVIAPDIGGGFGAKGTTYRDEILVAWLAVFLRRPVKWVSTRTEDLMTTQHGRGALARGELAVTGDGKIAGLRARIAVALGSQLVVNGAGPVRNHGRTMPGAYVVPALDIQATAAYTTTMSTGPYRGAGRPEGIFVMERLMDEAAHALGLDPAEIRRRNFVPAGAFPYRTATGQVYDSGDYGVGFERALTLAEYDRRRAEQAEARQRGEIVGVGLASYVEPSAFGWESGSVRIERTGVVTVVTGSSAHGQGHETTWAQIAADILGVPPANIRVRPGDTQAAPQGVGTFGSRSTALGGSAVFRAATEVREKGRRLAATILEAAPDDVTPVVGGWEVRGVPGRRVTWAQVADLAYRGTGLPRGETPGLDATVFFNGEGEVWSFGTCVATVTIDRDTGRVTLTRCVWVDDAGAIINPLLAEGQLHGSYAQGAGQALIEGVFYDAAGQLLTASLMDYAAPRADDFPEPVLGEMHTPSPNNPLGVKGLGEAGCIALPPTIVNAVVDALRPWGCTHVDMPLTSEKIWRILH
jgi:carbon-monoxide dehydrogenase large subunit